MTDFEAWRNEMKRLAGHWKLDPIYNGINNGGNRVLFYVVNPEDVTCGHYVMIEGAEATAGEFKYAIPHVMDGEFSVMWKHEYETKEQALTRVIERLGVNGLMAFMFGESPYRTH